jgi:hypothetical protein
MKRTVIPVLLVLLFMTAAFAVDKPLGVEEYTSIDELAVAISTYFPKVQGEIKAVTGDHLTLSLATKDGIKPGMTLTVWRDGKEILHPVTGAVIGRAEDEVGSIEVTSVGDGSSTAVVKKKVSEARPGDKVRITPRKINIALLPLKADHPEIIQTLSDRLKDLGRFTLLENEKVTAFIKDRKQRDSALVREMGNVFGLDAVVSIAVYPSEGKSLVTSRIFYTEDASQLDTIVATIDLRSKKELLGDVQPFFAPVQQEKSMTPELPVDAQLFVAGDFDGDGRLEYAFLDTERLHIYRLDPTQWREVWTEAVPREYLRIVLEQKDLSSVEDPSAHIQYINLDTADINGDGRPEIFVTAMLDRRAFSYAVQFQDGAFRRVAEVPGFLHVMTYPGRGTILVGQDYDPDKFYAGTPKQYTWSGGKYVPGPELPIPRGMGLYGLAFAEMGEKNPLMVAFDEGDRLIVYSQDTPLWKSEEKYSVMYRYVRKSATGAAAVLSKAEAESDKSLRQTLPGRIMTLDIGNDGKDEIILPKNKGEAFLSSSKGAELHGLRWTGARLDSIWSYKDLPGPVLDFQLLRQPNSNAQIVALVKIKGGLFSRDRQQLMIFSLK